MKKYEVFARSWWKIVNGVKIPHLGRKTHIGYADTAEEARSMCKVYDANHKPGRVDKRAEFALR